VEVPENLPELSEPPPSPQGTWTKVVRDNVIQALNNVEHREGWHQEWIGPIHVSYDSPFIVTPEPRYVQSSLPRRSVFGKFHEHGNVWWQLSSNLPSETPLNVGFPVPVLAVVFHPSYTGDVASSKNNGELRPVAGADELRWYEPPSDAPSTSGPSNPLRELQQKWEDEDAAEDEQTDN
jgi:hypothetical protein